MLSTQRPTLLPSQGPCEFSLLWDSAAHSPVGASSITIASKNSNPARKSIPKPNNPPRLCQFRIRAHPPPVSQWTLEEFLGLSTMQDKFGFLCNCPACSQDGSARRESDERRAHLGKLDSMIHSHATIRPAQVLEGANLRDVLSSM